MNSSAQAAHGRSDRENDVSGATWKDFGEGIFVGGSAGELWGSGFQGDVNTASGPVGDAPPTSAWGHGHAIAAPLHCILETAAAVVDIVESVVLVVFVVYVVVVFAEEPFVAASIAAIPLVPPDGTYVHW